MQSIQVDKHIKNIVKAIIFVIVLLSPFWTTRLLFLWLTPELTIVDTTQYIITAFRFDVKTIAIWFSPLFLLLGVHLLFPKKWLRVLCDSLFIALLLAVFLFNFSAIFYYPIAKSIVGADLFTLLSGQELGVVVEYFLSYGLYLILIVISLILIYWLQVKTHVHLKSIYSKLILNFLVLCFLVLAARGSFKLKPLNLLDAYAVLAPKEATSAVTPLYILLESFGKPSLEQVNFVSEEYLDASIKNDEKQLLPILDIRPNICLIILESFGKEYTGLNRAKRPSYTPFLDSLSKNSICFTNAYANGLRSMDAVASIMTGVPSFMKSPYIGSVYSTNSLVSVPEALLTKGYYSSFFHGADELSMGFKPFLKAEGVVDYYGKQQYPDDKDMDGTWGVFDGPFLKFAGERLASQPQPWFSGVFTLSSHHPYAVPQAYQYLADGTLPIHKAVRYTDESLKLFFEKYAQSSWFSNTVFIITADHTSINESDIYRTYRGKYEVPLLIYSPRFFPPKVVKSPVQHIDIYPTLFQLGGKNRVTSFGKSLFDTSVQSVKHFDGNVYTATSDSLSLQWNGVNQYDLFAYHEDPQQSENLSITNPQLGDSLFRELKLFIQKFNYKMINNEFE